MSDDSFIREVNEEIRQDQARALWDRFGPIAIGLAVLVVIATGAFVAYEYWTTSRANASGDAYSRALSLAEAGRTDEAIAALEALQADGFGAYPVLARMRAATALQAKGDHAAAVAAFDAVSTDDAVPVSIRDMARLRAGFILVDEGTYAEVSARVEALSAETNPLRHAAREALGLSAWKEGRATDALKLFEQVANDQAAPRNARERATLMAELIRSSGAAS